MLFGWLLNGIYVLILVAVSPILIYRRISQGKYRHGWNEKLTGRLVRQHPDRPCIWFHAVSVGEVVQLQKVVEGTASRFPDMEIVITVTTNTGYDVAVSKYGQHTVRYFPLDFTWAVSRALDSLRPSLVALVELELWPNFILIARQKRIPLMLVNGRMGAKSHRGYSRLKWLMARLLGCFDVLAVQSETYADRLRSLGAPADRVIVTGNIKYDGVQANRGNPKTEELRQAFELSTTDRVFIAGSTQDPEEAYAIEAWNDLRTEFPDLRLILVPRHKERFEEVATLIQERGFRAIRRSQSKPPVDPSRGNAANAIRLLDTLGELAACWGLADIAFVGGSLTNRGGQNMIEPAGYGAAVLFGPNTWNFKDITEALLQANAARVIDGRDQLREAVRDLFQRPDEARRMGDAASTFVASQQGATKRTIDLMENVLATRSAIEQGLS